jgi:hypothetical protein
VVNQRLYDKVRGQDHLTYDSSISYDLAKNGLYHIQVAGTMDQVPLTVESCTRCIKSLLDEEKPTTLELDSAVKRVIQQIQKESKSSIFWLDILHNDKVQPSKDKLIFISWNRFLGMR